MASGGLFGALGSLGGSTLGEVLVTVGLDTGNLDKGLARAKADASASGKSFTQLGVVAKAAFAAAAVAATKFAVDSVQAYNSYQAAVANLTATLRNNNNVIGDATAVFQEYSRSLSRTTGFTQTEITQAQALFAQYGLNVQQIEALTQVSIAYARTTGKDLTASAAGLGKALLGSGKAIKQIGQDFEDTGTLAGNFDEIIHLVGPSVEGASRAFADTGAGALAKFGAAWDSLKLAFGEQASGVVTGTLNFFTKVLTELPGVIGTVENAIIDLVNVEIIAANAIARIVNVFFPGLINLQGHLEEVNHDIEGLAPRLGLAGTKFGFVGRQVYDVGQSFKQLHDDTKQIITDFRLEMTGLDGVSKHWDLTANAAVRGSAIIAQKQRTIVNDLKKLDDLNIGEGLKKQMIALGPDMVHAFISGNHNQRQKILENLKDYNEAVKDLKKVATATAKSGGEAVGHALMDGMVKGIAAGRSAVTAAAQEAVDAMIAAARERAGIASPSTEGVEIGRLFAEGVTEGIEKYATGVVKAAQKLVDNFMEQFDKLKQRAADFKSSIAGGISGFKGELFSTIGGLFGQTDAAGNPITVTSGAISGAITGQVQQAQQLAAVLRQLSKAGLSQQLLAQLAGQGAAGIQEGQGLLADPSLISQANAAFSTITSIAGNTAAGQEAKFFGESLKRAKDHLEDLSDALQNVTDILWNIQHPNSPQMRAVVENAVYLARRRRQAA